MRKRQPFDFEFVKKHLGFALNPEHEGAATPEGQVTPCEFGRKETIEEETHYKRPALEPIDE